MFPFVSDAFAFRKFRKLLKLDISQKSKLHAMNPGKPLTTSSAVCTHENVYIPLLSLRTWCAGVCLCVLFTFTMWKSDTIMVLIRLVIHPVCVLLPHTQTHTQTHQLHTYTHYHRINLFRFWFIRGFAQWMADANFMHCHLSVPMRLPATPYHTMHSAHTYIFVTVLFINVGVNDAVNAKYMTLLLLLLVHVESLACPLHTYHIHMHTYVPSFVRLIGTSAFNGLYEWVSEWVSLCRITDTTTKHRIQNKKHPRDTSHCLSKWKSERRTRAEWP